jgi:hypothetical protein
MYNLDFKKEFLSIDFDELLLRFNNHFINDNIYTDYKNNYISNTNINNTRYNELVNSIISLENKELIQRHKNKYVYFIYEKDKLNSLKKECKNILLSQRNNLNFFLQYIDSLNNKFLAESKEIDSMSIKSDKSNKSKKSRKSKKNKNILSLFSK